MMPRLGDQDRLFINKFVYHFESIHRGDVVVFHYPRDPQKSYIKRVIAVPGDELRIDDGRTYVNGRLLPEPYVPRKFHDSRSQDAMVILPDQYFVMGDHRSISSDSRDFGPVSARPDLRQGRVCLLAGGGHGSYPLAQLFHGLELSCEKPRSAYRSCRVSRYLLNLTESTRRRSHAGNPRARRRAHLPR